MKKQYKNNSLIDELKRDYKQAREKRDFVAMREIYTELWRRDTKIAYPKTDREEFVFFTDISDDNSIIFPAELSFCFGKPCFISLFDEHLTISVRNDENDLVENYLKKESIEFEKTVFQKKLQLSPLALKHLKIKSKDILRIEVDSDEFDDSLNIYNENDGLIFNSESYAESDG